MGLDITGHARRRMRDHNILPGEADAVVEDPDWETARHSGKRVLGRGGIIVIIEGEKIVTAYRAKKEPACVGPDPSA